MISEERRTRRALWVAFVLCLSTVCGCGALPKGDGTFRLSGRIPLLPFSLPIFPSDLTLEGLAESVESSLSDYVSPLLISSVEPLIGSGVTELEAKLEQASLEILQPGVLSASLKGQVAEFLRQALTVQKVGFHFGLTNNTEKYVSAPADLGFFIGDATQAEDFDESVRINLQPGGGEDGEDPNGSSKGTTSPYILKPGESLELSVDNVDHLVELLNTPDAQMGLGYQNLYRMADTQNGADTETAVDKFGSCVVALAIQGSGISGVSGLPSVGEDCPEPAELAGWHLTVSKMELDVTVAGNILKVPEIADCSTFAEENSLEILASVCEPTE